MDVLDVCHVSTSPERLSIAMLAFVLFFVSFVVPFVLIGGLLAIAVRTPPVEPTPSVFHNSFVPMPTWAPGHDREPGSYGGTLRVPSSSIPGNTWNVHLN